MRLTSREKEIIEILQKEPLISQEELARRLSITRSSIAVHVSNLMKKGVILGRGYVFNERVSGVVLGQSAQAIKVLAARQDKNGYQARAKIETGFGGFAFNVGGCLGRFGMDVKVLTVLGTDEEGERILGLLQKLNVDTASVYRYPQGRTTKVVRLFDGEEIVQYSDGFKSDIFPQLLEVWESLIFNCEWLVVEPELQEMVAAKLAKRARDKRPSLCTLCPPGDIAGRAGYLAQFYLVVLGVRREQDMETCLREARQLVEGGLENLVVTDGSNRVWVATRETVVDIPLPPNQEFDVEEGLEPFLAGIIYGLAQGHHFRQAVRIGSGIASFSGGPNV